MSEFTGYPIELEDHGFIASLRGEDRVMQLYGTAQEVRFDPREVIQVEDQKSQGSCAGHSLSSILEWIYTVQTGQTGLQLSRAMAYYETQRIDGIRGDRGSTISGGVKLARTVGLCREELWKYPSQYDPSRPQNYTAVLDDAKCRIVGSETRIESYEAYRTFLGLGLGGVHNGIMWDNSMSKAVVEDYVVNINRAGGHAIAGLCLSERVDSNGDPYAWILNSWNKSFGNGGWQEWSPRAIRKMLSYQRQNSFVGLSDMPNVAPRKFTLEDWKKGLKA